MPSEAILKQFILRICEFLEFFKNLIIFRKIRFDKEALFLYNGVLSWHTSQGREGPFPSFPNGLTGFKKVWVFNADTGTVFLGEISVACRNEVY